MNGSSLSSVLLEEEISKQKQPNGDGGAQCEKPEAAEEDAEEAGYEEEEGTTNDSAADETRVVKLKELPQVHKAMTKTER